MKIAVMGYGTIGSGVVEVLNINQEKITRRAGEPVEVKYVLDLRDFPGDPIQDKVIRDYKIIAEDPEVGIVVETMGGVEPAYTFVKAMLEAGKQVTTSNKNLVAAKGAELIAIARAAIADPPVLVMDEATSSIDTHTEALVQKGMDRLMENRTVFVIAHRLSTVRNSNAIMVLEDGRIIERGDHQTLLQQKGVYYRLYTGQSELS